MIGVTLEPGASGVSSAGSDVWNPELLSPAPAGNATIATTAAAPAARTHSLFLISLSPLRIACGRESKWGRALRAKGRASALDRGAPVASLRPAAFRARAPAGRSVAAT